MKNISVIETVKSGLQNYKTYGLQHLVFVASTTFIECFLYYVFLLAMNFNVIQETFVLEMFDMRKYIEVFTTATEIPSCFFLNLIISITSLIISTIHILSNAYYPLYMRRSENKNIKEYIKSFVKISWLKIFGLIALVGVVSSIGSLFVIFLIYGLNFFIKNLFLSSFLIGIWWLILCFWLIIRLSLAQFILYDLWQSKKGILESLKYSFLLSKGHFFGMVFIFTTAGVISIFYNIIFTLFSILFSFIIFQPFFVIFFSLLLYRTQTIFFGFIIEELYTRLIAE